MISIPWFGGKDHNIYCKTYIDEKEFKLYLFVTAARAPDAVVRKA
ncbi:hypothetical protein GCM10017764_19910 [Sphingobacterium griseoflavum]|uniref:Uncharacterized protein n=1 Tax=Sphingobacterium griseoflavum TaxID=1474952 RepID=A0ABQ3HUU6_9SPHI|nr:hypothetical protein GCM10017764_19910 [Sphingobacterium griseoflavum]